MDLAEYWVSLHLDFLVVIHHRLRHLHHRLRRLSYLPQSCLHLKGEVEEEVAAEAAQNHRHLLPHFGCPEGVWSFLPAARACDAETMSKGRPEKPKPAQNNKIC